MVQTIKRELILASQSPRRKQLLMDAGYQIRVLAPDESVEAGVCSACGPQELVLEASYLKARHVASQIACGWVLGADTVAECDGQILGKPRDQSHAEQMLRLMTGKTHSVLTGVTIWHRPSDLFVSKIEQTVLEMDAIPDDQLAVHLDSGEWEGKAGAFGYQDGLDWVHVVSGLESNVVGLPIEKLPEWFRELEDMVS